MYFKDRYFTVTGIPYNCAKYADEVADDNGALEKIHTKYIKPRSPKKKESFKIGFTGLADNKVLELARNSQFAAEFNELWAGNWQGKFKSQSEADYDFCKKLAYLSGKNAEQIDRLFRQSELMRAKWDEVRAIHEHNGRLLYVDNETAVAADGTVDDTIVQLERYVEIESDILKKAPITDMNDLVFIGANIFGYNEYIKTVPILAWIAACFVKNHLWAVGAKFPQLSLFGESGGGKSTTFEWVATPIFSYITTANEASQMSKFTLMLESASSNLVPQAIEEFKPSKMGEVLTNHHNNHFRSVYDKHKGKRGKPDLTRRVFQLTAPIIVAGEENPNEGNKELIAWMRESKPTDIIRLTEEGDKEIMHIWECSRDEKIKEEGLTIPSDLFFANTIPLTDCEIYIDERKTGGHMIHFRVVIFSDYKERIANVDEADLALVGAIEIPHNMPNISCSSIIPILVKSGVDVICTCEIAHRNMPSDLVKYYKQNAVMGDILQLGTQCLETWYGIQVSLLHPTVKDVFRKPRTAPKQDSKTNQKKNHKPPKIRYIREHIVNATELAESAFGKSEDGKTINRKSLVWYVIGHWRVYENGKKVFVKPYFKGALRDAGLPVDPREREIVKSELTDEADDI